MRENTLKSAKSGVLGAGVRVVTEWVTEQKPQRVNFTLCGCRSDSPPNRRANGSHREQGFCIGIWMVTNTIRTAVIANHADQMCERANALRTRQDGT